VETIEEMLHRKFWLEKRIEEELNDSGCYAKLTTDTIDIATIDTATTDENSVSPTL